MSGSGRDPCSIPIRSATKKRRIRRAIRGLPPRWVTLFEDETDLRLFPPLRAARGRRGRAVEVPTSGFNARRVAFGTIDIDTGHRLFLVRRRRKGEDSRAFLPVIRSHDRGWHVAPLLDEDPGHTAAGSQELAAELGIRLIWLPKRCPELNGMDHLWGHGKDHVCADRQYAGIDEEVDRSVGFLGGLSNREALRQAGILSEDFWLRV
ncbi:MAG TPA: transposase [Isosphaeraceae bacterium]|jgi:transposase InsO family protein|nr:transposase [Isosphaeraceae bacterium]